MSCWAPALRSPDQPPSAVAPAATDHARAVRRTGLRGPGHDWSHLRWGAASKGQRKPDLGDGTFLNPLISGDHPDPSILRDGANYYLTFSSFDAYPGLAGLALDGPGQLAAHRTHAAQARGFGLGARAGQARQALLQLLPRAYAEVPFAVRDHGREDRGAVERSGRSRSCLRTSIRAMRWARTASVTCSCATAIACASPTTAWPPRARSSTSTILALSTRVERRDLRARGAEGPAPWRVVLSDPRGRWHCGAADRAHGDRRAFALHPRALGERS